MQIYSNLSVSCRNIGQVPLGKHSQRKKAEFYEKKIANGGEFYETFSQRGGGSTGFHISYSEMLNL